MPVFLDRNPLHVDTGCRCVPVPQGILRLDDACCGLTHPAGERVPRLVQVNIPDAGHLAYILLAWRTHTLQSQTSKEPFSLEAYGKLDTL